MTRRSSFIWIGPRGEDAGCLGAVETLAGIVCADWSPALKELAARIPIHSIEKGESIRRLTASTVMTSLDPTPLLRPAASRAVLVPYRTYYVLEELCARVQGVTLLAPPAELVAILDNKIFQRTLFARNGIPCPKWTTAPAGNLAPTAQFPPPYVVQHAVGSLGTSTVLTDLQPRNGTNNALLVSEYIEGPVVNVNAVCHRGAVSVSWPSIQLTGLSECGSAGKPFLYCGNDFTAVADLGRALLSEIREITTEVGRIIITLGYDGPFGLDFIASKSGPLVLEINPRFQGSTAAIADLERACHGNATLDGWLHGDNRTPLPFEPLQGAEIVLYAETAGTAAQRGLGWRCAAIPGTPVANGACIGKLRFRERVLLSDLKSLAAQAARAVKGIS